MFNGIIGRCAQQHQRRLKKLASDDKLATGQKTDRGKISGTKVHSVVGEKRRYWLEYKGAWEGEDFRKAACPGPRCCNKELGFTLNGSVRKSRGGGGGGGEKGVPAVGRGVKKQNKNKGVGG